MRRKRLRTFFKGCGLALLALVALTKHVSFVFAAFVVVLVAADKALRKRPVAACLIPANTPA